MVYTFSIILFNIMGFDSGHELIWSFSGSFSYSNSPLSDNLSSYPSNFDLPNFITLAQVSYISHCLLHDDVIPLKITYKKLVCYIP